jgi:hypothetical protein
MIPQTMEQVVLRRARDLAGGVSHLSHKIGVRALDLDTFIQGHEPIPRWLFLRALDFLGEAEDASEAPPGFPSDWRDHPASEL